MKKKVYIYDMTQGNGELICRITGDIGGNAQETEIEVDSEGGQFPLTEIEKTETGFKFKIIGTWEATELLTALSRLAEDSGNLLPPDDPRVE